MTQIENNFLGLPREYSDYKSSKYAVLPIPYDSTVSFQVGTRNGPAAIIACSQQVELFDEESRKDHSGAGIATLPALMPNVAGPKEMTKDIHTCARKVVRDGKFLIGLGGEHSVSAGLIQAVAEKYKNISVLQIDAHCDLRNSYEGSPYSHASVMRRALEHAARLVSVGIRNMSEEEHRFVRKNSAPQGNVTLVTARECLDSDVWYDRAVDALGDHVYVTIDIDGFDPAYAPGTGTPEPGGLDWYQVTDLLRLVAAEKKIVAADVVEVLPIPGQAVTEFLAARLIYKLIGYIESAER